MATALEAKASHIEKMGLELGEQYSELWQDIAYLHMKWGEYVQLFGTKSSRIDLINKAAPAFFGMFEREMWKNILLHLARLTDPTQSLGKKNLTLQSLPNLVGDDLLRDKLNRLLATASERTKFCRDWRNRTIAHRDLDLALDRPSVALENGSRKDVKSALDIVDEIMNQVSGFYLDSETHFRSEGFMGGARALLYVIDDGLREADARRDRLKQGAPLKEDYLPRDI